MISLFRLPPSLPPSRLLVDRTAKNSCSEMAPGSRGIGKNLVCGVCGEIYRFPDRSPRLLSCFHTFCLPCLEDLTKAYCRTFTCPQSQCGKLITIPGRGAAGFEVNPYITEEELERERRRLKTTMCPNPHHDGEPMVFFCAPCEEQICIKCKLTKHENHQTEDLSAVAARSVEYLEKSKTRLNKTISYLAEISTDAQGNLRAAKRKRKALSEQVQVQCDSLVKKIRTVCDNIQTEIDTSSSAVEERLTEDAQNIQKELDSLIQLRQDVFHALRPDASDSDKLLAENGVKTVESSKPGTHKMKKYMPATTSRPGLHVFNESVSEDDIRMVLGIPVELSMKFRCCKEIKPIFQYKYPKEVYGLCQIESELFSVVIWDPSSGTTIDIFIDEEGNQDQENIFLGRKSYKRYSRNERFRSSCEFISSDKKNFLLNSKGYRSLMFQVLHFPAEKTSIFKVEVSSKNPVKLKKHHVFDTNLGKPVAFDATSTGDVIALVETVKDEQSQRACETKQQVCLYRSSQGTPFTTYTPGDAISNFCPSDVCFWQENDQDRLLVADRQNDCVHVLSIHEDQVRFERYLAAGDSNLVRPTALNVDDKGRVWIGCENGIVLRCETVEAETQKESENENESDVDDDGSDVSSKSNSSHVSDRAYSESSSMLRVENTSRSTGSSFSSEATIRSWINAQKHASVTVNNEIEDQQN